MKPYEVTFLNQDRQYAVEKVREHLVELLDAAPKKDYDAIKTIYGLVLKEEDQDNDRRRTTLAEIELNHKIAMDEKAAAAANKVADAKKPKLLPVSELKERIRLFLGKGAQ
jgi:hypothetical protein